MVIKKTARDLDAKNDELWKLELPFRRNSFINKAASVYVIEIDAVNFVGEIVLPTLMATWLETTSMEDN